MLEKGEIVFRRMPSFARPPKHVLSAPSTGPYIVMDQRSLFSAVLLDPAANMLVGGEANVPLDQLLASPRRSKLDFEPDSQSERATWPTCCDPIRPGRIVKLQVRRRLAGPGPKSLRRIPSQGLRPGAPRPDRKPCAAQ